MNGTKLLIDTNIALYLLNGDKKLAELIDGKVIYVSFITELELLGYKALTDKDKQLITNFLNDCIIIDINKTIKDSAIIIKRRYGTKLPDAVIAATADAFQMPLMTADKGFSQISQIQLNIYNPG